MENKKWYEEHKEEISARMKKYREDHAEELKKYQREYVASNMDKVEKWRVNSCIRKLLKVYGMPAENDETYIDLGDIRLVFRGIEYEGWYNPNYGVEMES